MGRGFVRGRMERDFMGIEVAMERSGMWLVMGFAVCYRKHSWAIGF
jgi:hypothetical protein